MSRGLTKAISVWLFLLFVGGVLLLPFFHRMHCDGHHGTHGAAQCPICQLANTLVITTVAHIAPIVESIIVGDVVLPQSFIPSVPFRGAAQARAPPVA